MLFKGCCTALITPFKTDGSIDFSSFKKIIDFQIQNGISALLFLGTTGEPSTMTKEERIEVVKFACDYVNGRAKIIIGAGTNSTSTTIDNINEYSKFNIDGLLIVTPYYNKCTQNGLIKHYEEICKNTTLPIIIYNVPGRTGFNILPKTYETLSKLPNIVGIKEASGNIEQIIQTIKLCNKNCAIYSGDDGLTIPILSMGGKGVISVASNIIPYEMSEMCKEYFIGNVEVSCDMQLRYYNLIKLLFSETNPIPIKAAANFLGLCENVLRMPLTPIEKENFEKLRHELINLKLCK